MKIEQFIGFAKGCKTKAELSSLAKSNGINLSKESLDKLFSKITSGDELNDAALEAAAGGTTHGATTQQIQDFIG